MQEESKSSKGRLDANGEAREAFLNEDIRHSRNSTDVNLLSLAEEDHEEIEEIEPLADSSPTNEPEPVGLQRAEPTLVVEPCP